MEISHAELTSSPRFTASNNIVDLGETTLVHPAGRAADDKWVITQDLTAISNPPRHHDLWDSNDKLSVQYGQKIKDIRHVITSVEDPLQRLMLVDAIQRLGIDYHFQEEIEAILQREYSAINLRNHEYQTLFEVSLCFRLLRQEGYYVPQEVFNAFKDKEGRFNEEMRRDIRGLMELYEAAQLNLDGEDVLYEAANFSRKHLNDSLKHLDNYQATKVRNTLKHPYHKSLSKFMAKSFLKDFKGIYRWIQPLQELAWMEFMMAQRTHRRELSQISKWWKDLQLSKDLELARNQPLKWYTWTMASITDTSLSELRIELTKCISFIYIIDDIFDIYGTLDQLNLFTEVVNRWDIAKVGQLPDYIKMCFKALYDQTNEIGEKIGKKYGHNPVYFLQETWATLCNAFLVEANWFASRDVPRADEYLKVATVSTGVRVVLVHLFFLLGLGATKETAICLNDTATMTSSVATILRLWDDLGSAKDENQDGRDGSYIDYYVQEHGVTIEFARDHVFKLISEEWKRLNNESIRVSKVSASFTKASLNLTRMVPLMYNYDDDQRLPLLEDHIKALFNDDLSLELIS